MSGKFAQGVLSKATCLGYKRHIETARELISGNTYFSRTIQNMRNVAQERHRDEYDTSTLETEEDIQDYVNFMMQTFKIPEERRDNVLIDVLCTRDGIREKLQWCRYLEIEQNLTHTLLPLTHYAEDSNRRGVCLRFKYVVDSLSPKWAEQVEEFKRLYCSVCTSREPQNRLVG